MGINLGGGNIGMTEEFLNDAEVSPSFEEMGGKRMTQEVRIDGFG